MDGQMTIFDWLYPRQLNPIREVAERESPYWTTSKQKLIDLCNTDPSITLFSKEVRHEYCPYGLCGHYCDNENPNEIIGWDMMTDKITVYYRDAEGQKRKRQYTWQDFARAVADLIWSGEYGGKNE